MPCDKDFPSFTSHDHADTTERTLGNEGEFGNGQDILATQLRVTAVRHIEHIIESTEDGQRGHERMLWEDTEHLLRQWVFGYPIMIIKSRLGSPANIECAGDMGACPTEDAAYLLPVSDLLIIEMLHRSTRDDHSVELLIGHLLKVPIECPHVLHGGVLAGMSLDLHEVDVQLEWGVGEETDEVCLGGNLQRHQIEYHDAKRSDVLTTGPFVPKHENILVLEELYSGQFIWQS